MSRRLGAGRRAPLLLLRGRACREALDLSSRAVAGALPSLPPAPQKASRVWRGWGAQSGPEGRGQVCPALSGL
eukprot:2722119-Pyramimonas_sp.AAC.1